LKFLWRLLLEAKLREADRVVAKGGKPAMRKNGRFSRSFI
jgi:hypothetical protein